MTQPLISYLEESKEHLVCPMSDVSYPRSASVPLSDVGGSEAVKEVIERDRLYYFTEVIFLKLMFKVPRGPFERNSEVFQDMFGLPVPHNTVPDGSSDEHPLRLDGVKKNDFRQLLKVMFPRSPREAETMSWQEWSSVLKLSMMWQMSEMQQAAVEKISSIPVSVEEWVDVLKLSTLWHIYEIRNKAMEKLTNCLQPVCRVVLGRECHVSEWLSRGYREIVGREETITESDEENLGSIATIKLRDLIL